MKIAVLGHQRKMMSHLKINKIFRENFILIPPEIVCIYALYKDTETETDKLIFHRWTLLLCVVIFVCVEGSILW